MFPADFTKFKYLHTLNKLEHGTKSRLVHIQDSKLIEPNALLTERERWYEGGEFVYKVNTESQNSFKKSKHTGVPVT